MRKILIMILSLLLLSGCNLKAISKKDNSQIINTILSLNIKNYNKIGNGYKYYAPKGVVRVDANEYNDVLKKNNRVYYLYVDVVGYYYNSDFKGIKNNDYYFYEILSKKGKNGYIKVEQDRKNKDSLYVQMFYNYAKIETYVSKRELKDTLIDISYILSSLDFNDVLLNKMYEEGAFSSKEEVFKLFENKSKEGNFLEYIEEYDKYNASDESEEAEIKVKENVSTTTKSSKNNSN